MKVLVIIFEELVPISGGGTPRITHIIKSFVRKGHNVYVAAALGVNKKQAIEELGCTDIVPLINVSRLSRKKMMKYMYAHPLNILKVLLNILKIKPDIIISHNSIAGFSARLAKLIGMKAVTVLNFTDLLFEYLDSYSTSLLMRTVQFFGRKMEENSILKSDKIITISNSMKKILETYGCSPENIEIVSDGVDTSVFKPLETPFLREKYAHGVSTIVNFQGVIDPQDDPEIVIEAARKVLKTKPDTMFWIIGDGTAIPLMKQKVAEYNLEEKFYFSGWVRQKQMPEYISASDIGLVVLPDIISARGRVTLKEFEYWACGVPAIVPRLPALEEVVEEGQTGIFYQPSNIDDLVQKILFLIENNDIRKRLGQNGLKMVREKYEWKTLADKIVSFCEKFKETI